MLGTQREWSLYPPIGVLVIILNSLTCGHRQTIKNFLTFIGHQFVPPLNEIFGSLKGFFKVFSSKPFFPFKTQPKLVLVACIWHNYIISDDEEWIPQQPASKSNMR